MDFTGRAAIVTGAGSGIGFKICEELTNRGCQVLLNDLDTDLCQQAQQRIDSPNCHTLAGDAGSIDFINEMVDCCLSLFGRVDYCIANAGITSFGAFLDFTPERFETLVNLNLRGSFFLAQRCAQEMIRQESGGRVLLMSSVTGLLSHPHLAAYGMTKAALQSLAKVLVQELGPHRITTNAIAPGAVATERTLSDDPNYRQLWSKALPTGRISDPIDIAEAALFLLSDAAAQITGQTLTVDGGITSLCISPEELAVPEE